MGIFSNESLRNRNLSKKYEDLYFATMEERLGNYREALKEYRNYLKKYEEKLNEYDDHIVVYTDNSNEFIKKLDHYEEKIQWYEEQQDVYSRKAKKEQLVLKEIIGDIEELKNQGNRLCIQLEDMKENQVDRLAEDTQDLLAKQADLLKMVSLIDMDKIRKDISEQKESILENMEAQCDALRKENKSLGLAVKLLYLFHFITFVGIVAVVFYYL